MAKTFAVAKWETIYHLAKDKVDRKAFENRVALNTDAGMGIGFATAKLFAEAGASYRNLHK